MKETITILVLALGAWGKGKTYQEALAKCVDVGGLQNARNLHIVYACTDPECSVTERGDIEYHQGTALTKIMALRFGRIMKPK